MREAFKEALKERVTADNVDYFVVALKIFDEVITAQAEKQKEGY